MRREFLAAACALTVVTAAYAQTGSKPQGAAEKPSSQSGGSAVTVEGCVMKEIDVPGRRPPENLRAQAEADDDYVLTSTSIISGNAPSAAAKSPKEAAAVATSGAAGTGLMYDIEGIAKDQLRQHVGKRVQIEGVFNHLENAKLPVSFATDLVELKGTTLRSVPGACPSK